MNIEYQIFYKLFRPFFSNKDALLKVCQKMSEAENLHSPSYQKTNGKNWKVNGIEIDRVPVRIYCEEVNTGNFSENEAFIYNCIFTLHHNGHIRQKYLNKIINIKPDESGYFVFNLVGQYVVEVLHDIERKIKYPLYLFFVRSNLEMWQTRKKQIVSYYYCYYDCHDAYKLDNKAKYPGFIIMTNFDHLLKAPTNF